MKLYRTVFDKGEAELTIERSRFIAHVSPAAGREEAEDFIAKIRREHRDATHNVPAMVLGDKMQVQWASDDGEPQGTSGAPMVKLMTSLGVTNTVIVTTRYFGGVKLGTGGLARAYTSAARLGLDAAGICEVTEKEVLTYVLDYQFLAKLRSLEGELFSVEDVRYADVVEVELACEPAGRGEVEGLLRNLTAGRAVLKDASISLVKIPLTK